MRVPRRLDFRDTENREARVRCGAAKRTRLLAAISPARDGGPGGAAPGEGAVSLSHDIAGEAHTAVSDPAPL